MKKIKLFDLDFCNLDYNETIELCYNYIREGIPRSIFTPNTDFIVRAEKDNNFKNILKKADCLLSDGMPIVWYSKLLKNKLKMKISGSTLFYKLCKLSRERDLKLFILGGMPSSLLKAVENIRTEYGDIISDYYSPPINFENNEFEIEKIIKLIKISKPDILVVCLGSPKQEDFIIKYKNDYNIALSLGLGGTVDFVSGEKKMPPQWIKRIGFAWLFRLILEPRRLYKRYLVDDVKLIKIIFREIRDKKYDK